MSFASYRGRLAATTAISAAAAVIIMALSAGCNRSRQASGPLSGVLEGRVTDLADRPLGEVTVEVGADPPDGRVPVARTRTSTTGAYRIERVPPGRYRVTGRKAAHATVE